MRVIDFNRSQCIPQGAIPIGNATKHHLKSLGLLNGQTVRKCNKCMSIKPDRAHHCSVCRR